MVRLDELDSHNNTEEAILRKQLAALDVQRRSMEHEADAIFLELTSPPSEGVEPMGMDTPLVDDEGYPRGDIDIYRCRTLRQRFRVVQKDHKDLEQKIDGLLKQLAAIQNPKQSQANQEEQKARDAPKPKPKYDPVTGKWVVMNWDGTIAGIPQGEQRQFHDLGPRQLSGLTNDESPFSSLANSIRSTPATSPPSATTTTPTTPTPKPIPKAFARIDAVANGSPAETAGLKEEDLIVGFGHLHADNHNHLKEIAALVPDEAAAQRAIPVVVRRRQHHRHWETCEISLTPRPWNGRGLIGCHIVPYRPPEASSS